MGAGRPPKPTALKRAQGNPGKRKLPAEPTPPPPSGAAVTPPPWALQAWADDGPQLELWAHLAAILAPMGLLTTADADKLALCCDAYADYLAAVEAIRDEGITLHKTTDRGGESVIANPAVAIRNDAWRRVDHVLSEFGMSPVARSKVGANGGEDADPFEEFEGPAISGGQRVKGSGS